MITRTELQRISQYHDPSGHILSLYLPLAVDGTDDHLIEVKNLLRDAELRYRKTHGTSIPDEVHSMCEDVRVFVRDDAGRYGRALSIFASANQGILETYAVPRTIEPSATLDQRPEIAPMIRVVEDYQPLCTCIISRDQARIFTGRFDELEESALLDDPDVPGKHEQGGWSQARFQRHIEDHVHRHFKRVAGELFAMLETDPYSFLILGGPEEVVAAFRDELHPYVQERIIGDVRLLMEANINDVRQHSLAVVEHSINQSKARLIERIRQQAEARDLGVAGLDATLDALHHRQILSLAIDRHLHASGVRCDDCGAMSVSTGQGNDCQYCSGAVREIENVAPALITTAYQQGADVAVIETQELGDALAHLGGVGALLRFRLESQNT